MNTVSEARPESSIGNSKLNDSVLLSGCSLRSPGKRVSKRGKLLRSPKYGNRTPSPNRMLSFFRSKWS